MKVLSMSSVYVLRALIYITSKEENSSQYVSIGEMSKALNLSFHFLTKTFQVLTQHGIVVSYRGPKGGIALAKSPEDIYLSNIVYVLEGQDFFDKCLLGLPGCGRETPCPVHDFWKQTREQMQHEFERTSLAELGKKVSENRLRLIGD